MPEQPGGVRRMWLLRVRSPGLSGARVVSEFCGLANANEGCADKSAQLGPAVRAGFSKSLMTWRAFYRVPYLITPLYRDGSSARYKWFLLLQFWPFMAHQTIRVPRSGFLSQLHGLEIGDLPGDGDLCREAFHRGCAEESDDLRFFQDELGVFRL